MMRIRLYRIVLLLSLAIHACSPPHIMVRNRYARNTDGSFLELKPSEENGQRVLVNEYERGGILKTTSAYSTRLNRMNADKLDYYFAANLLDLESIISYFPGENRKVSIDFTSDGPLHRYRSYYRSGPLKYETFYNARTQLFDGDFVAYYETGEKKIECSIVQGVKQGWETSYYRNGDAKTKAFYGKSGLLQDTLMSFYTGNEIRRIERYDSGKLIAGKLYDEKGGETDFFPFEQPLSFRNGTSSVVDYYNRNVTLPASIPYISAMKVSVYARTTPDGVLENLHLSYGEEEAPGLSVFMEQWIKGFLNLLVPAQYDGENCGSVITFELNIVDHRIDPVKDFQALRINNVHDFDHYWTYNIAFQWSRDWQSIVYAVDQRPAYPGGMKRLAREIKINTAESKEFCQDAGGKALVDILIDEHGEVIHAEMIEGICEMLDYSIRWTLKSGERWIPAMKNGQNVRCRMILPIMII